MAEQNKALACRFYDDVINKKNLGAIDELGSPDFVDHSNKPGQASGLKGAKDNTAMFLKAFPDMKVTVEEIVAEGDIVVARVSGTGTHKGNFFGTPATGKRVSFHGIDMMRYKGGKVVEVLLAEALENSLLSTRRRIGSGESSSCLSSQG